MRRSIAVFAILLLALTISQLDAGEDTFGFAAARAASGHNSTSLHRSAKLLAVPHWDGLKRLKRLAKQRELRAARRRARQRAAARQAAQLAAASVVTPTVSAPGASLDAIAQCESHGDPTAISAGGTYRGKYQFSRSTWKGVGGSGDPAAAPEAEQDRRAAMLYARSGPGRWPTCGQ